MVNLLGYLRYRHTAFKGLPAGHGDGVIIENLIGNIDPGRDGLADGQGTGMHVSAVAEVLENMI